MVKKKFKCKNVIEKKKKKNIYVKNIFKKIGEW